MRAQQPRFATPGASGAALGVFGASESTQAVQRLVLEDFPSPAVARALSPNGRGHWGVERRAKAVVTTAVVTGIRACGLRPATGPVRLTCRWIFPTRARRDLDNLSTGVVKRLIDVLREEKILVDDDSTHVVELKAEAVYEKGRRALIVEMEPAA